MPMSLEEVLDHPSVLPGEPTVLVEPSWGSRPVRWIHSSEVIDIASLLRGGELLLTGGVVLSKLGAPHQRVYVRELAERGVAALAVETATSGVDLSEALIDECRKQDFPLIRLARAVPFVEITESINGVLINESVQRLRLADSLSDALSAQLTSGADLQQLTETLANSTGAEVTIRDRSGGVLAAGPQCGHDINQEAERHRAPITVHGVTSAHLEFLPSPGTERGMLEAALDRAPQSFGLALLRAQPPTPDAHAARVLFQRLRTPTDRSADLAALVTGSGLHSADTFVAVVASHAEPGFCGALEQVVQRSGRKALSHVDDHEFLALVTLDSYQPERSRLSLVEDVRHVAERSTEGSTVGVGPLVTGSDELPHTVAEARRCLRLPTANTSAIGVVDAAACSLDRLVHQLDADETLHRFVHEHLGGLLHEPHGARERLLRTLQTFFECAANKTRTAERLHVRRQTLYQRLAKLSECLGRDVTDPERIADLQIAVRLRSVLNAHDSE